MPMTDGEMQQYSLTLDKFLSHAAKWHPEAEVVTAHADGESARVGYADLLARSQKVSAVLKGLGIRAGDRVATLAWNGYRHLELYYGVSGSGSVLHTLNPRLHPDQVVWIADHAEDQVLFFDLSFLPLVQAVHAQCPTIRQYVALCEGDKLPADTGIPTLVSYESWIGAQPTDYQWPSFDENSASSMCLSLIHI